MAVASADASLTLLEKHVHEAEMTWSESRLKMAKNGFCDQHPYIQLRKKKWFGKEKVLMKTCPRCDEEHNLKMQGYRLQLEAAALSLQQQGLLGPNNNSQALLMAPPSLQQANPWTSALPPLPLAGSVALPAVPLQQQPLICPPATATPTAQPEAAIPLHQPEQPIIRPTAAAPPAQPEPQTKPQESAYAPQCRSRFARLMAANPHRKGSQSSSCQSLAAPQAITAPRHLLPERSTSCRAVLHGIPEHDEGEERKEEIRNDSTSSINSSHSLPLNSSLSQMDVPLNQSVANTPACSSCQKGIRQSVSFGDTPKDPPIGDRVKYLQIEAAEIATISAPPFDPKRKFKAAVKTVVATDRLIQRVQREDDDRKPVAKAQPDVNDQKPAAKSQPEDDRKAAAKTDKQIKEEEKRRKKVGAISKPGNTDTLQDMTELAKYAMSSVTEIQGPATSSPDSPNSPLDKTADISCMLEEEVATKDPVKDCVNTLKWKCKRPHEAEQALHELQALCQLTEDDQTAVVMGDGLQTVLDTMKTFSNDAGVQEEACWVLGTLACENDDHKQLIAEAGGIIAIVSSMKALESHAGFQETACEVVTYLTEGHLLNKIAVCESGGVAAIVNAMEYHSGCVRVQEKGCSVLGDLALGAPNLVANSGGIAAIFAAMMEHKFNPGLQESACVALGNLASQNECDAKFLIAQAGGIGFILAALRHHAPQSNEGDSGVQESACFALQNVAHNSPENKDMMVGCGALSELLGLLKNPKTEASVFEAVCDTLIILVQHHNAAKDALVSSGGVPLLVSILEGDNHYASVQRAACRVLANLCHNHDQNKVLIAGEGGIAAILACMISRNDNPGLLECAFKALTSLTVNKDNRIALAEACGIDYIVTAMFNNLTHAGIQESGCRAMVNLACCDNVRDSIVESNGVAAILAAMDNHRNNVTVQEKACGALRELAVKDSNEIVIANAGGIDAILAALKRHENHHGLFRNACGALQNISFHDESCKAKIVESIGFGSLLAARMESFVAAETSDNSSQGSSSSF